MVKQILSIFCLAAGFICGCQGNASSAATDHTESRSVEAAKSSEENKSIDTAASEQSQSTVIAYYFHRTMRCPACLEIEAAARRVIESRFENQLANEKLMWIPLNLDDSGGEQFEKEFDISVSTLIITKMEDGNHAKYKKLEKVWDFIGDPVKFDEYVQTEVNEFLNE